ncbi:MAG: hypothetical protein WA945_02970 [Arcobacteraceae bacterium]
MNLNETIQEYFTRDSIIDMLTRYELYYQISLGSYVLETLQDIDETVKKLKELNLLIEIDTALSNIFEIILHNCYEEDFEDKFDYHLRCRALMHSLKDFINKDKDLLNSDDYSNDITQQILKDTYFKESMKLQLESDYNSLYHIYEQIVSEELSRTLAQNILKQINNVPDN